MKGRSICDLEDIEMLRLASSVCPFCEAKAIFKAIHPSWQSSRTAATLQKRKPSRMTLSPTVKRAPGGDTASDVGKRRSRERRGNETFGGMNVTAVPSRLRILKNVSSDVEQRRTSRGKGFQKNGKDEKRSKGPMHALKMQRALTNVSYEKRNRTKQMLQERDNFAEFDLLPSIKESIATQALGGMVDISPTPVQRLALPALLGTEDAGRRKRRNDANGKEMQQYLLAAETGSGKTLAYLLPVVDAIKRAEAAEAQQEARNAAREEHEKRRQAKNRVFDVESPQTNEPHPSTARPRAIILLPTSELVEQVGHLVKSISHAVKYRSALLSVNYTGQVIRSRLFSTSGIDVVVSTPHLLHSITESDPNILSRVSHLVIDEADSLLDRSFSPITSSIIDRASPSLRQLILCSATIPKSLDSYLHKRFPDLRRLVTPNLHAIPRRVQLSVIDIDKIPYQGNRNLACAQVIWDIGKEASEQGEERLKKIVVFVNEREKTSELAEYLRSKGIDAAALSRDSNERNQAETLASFTGAGIAAASKQQQTSPKHKAAKSETFISPGDLMESPSSNSRRQPPPLRQLSNTQVLVTTDIASRGIDTLPVKHVILYNVPHTSIDFIHRLGRVGRMNRRGRGVVLVGKNDRKDIVREVRDGMFKGAALI